MTWRYIGECGTMAARNGEAVNRARAEQIATTSRQRGSHELPGSGHLEKRSRPWAIPDLRDKPTKAANSMEQLLGL